MFKGQVCHTLFLLSFASAWLPLTDMIHFVCCASMNFWEEVSSREHLWQYTIQCTEGGYIIEGETLSERR